MCARARAHTHARTHPHTHPVGCGGGREAVLGPDRSPLLGFPVVRNRHGDDGALDAAPQEFVDVSAERFPCMVKCINTSQQLAFPRQAFPGLPKGQRQPVSPQHDKEGRNRRLSAGAPPSPPAPRNPLSRVPQFFIPGCGVHRMGFLKCQLQTACFHKV